MANASVPFHVEKRVIEHPRTGARICSNIYAKNDLFYTTSLGTITPNYVHGECHAPGSHANSTGAQYLQVTARINTGSDGRATTGYTQAKLEATPGTQSQNLSDAGVFFQM